MLVRLPKFGKYLARKLMRFQLIFIFIGVFWFIWNSLLSGILVDCSKLSLKLQVDSYSECNTPFCRTAQLAGGVLNDNMVSISKFASLSLIIWRGNLWATLNEIILTKYIFSGPFLALRQNSIGVGVVSRCMDNGIMQLLFPHGIIEIIAMILFFSTYYSFLLNLSLGVYGYIMKKKAISQPLLVRTSYWFLLVISLYFVAAILESVSIVF